MPSHFEFFSVHLVAEFARDGPSLLQWFDTVEERPERVIRAAKFFHALFYKLIPTFGLAIIKIKEELRVGVDDVRFVAVAAQQIGRLCPAADERHGEDAGCQGCCVFVDGLEDVARRALPEVDLRRVEVALLCRKVVAECEGPKGIEEGDTTVAEVADDLLGVELALLLLIDEHDIIIMAGLGLADGKGDGIAGD